MGRPARIPQPSGRFAAVWDDVLPPLPEDLWRANVAAVVAALAAGANQPPAGGSASGEKLR